MGGGEKYVGTAAEILSERHAVDMFITRRVDLGILQGRLGLNLQRVGTVELSNKMTTRPRTVGEWLRNRGQAQLLQSELLQLTRGYDVAIQLESDSPFRLAARRNILHIQVPHRCWRMGDFLGAIRQNRLADARREFSRSLTFRGSLNHFDLLIYNSDFTARIVKGNWHPRVPSLVIHPPIDVPAIAAKWDEKRNYILSVGRFFASGHEKRQEALIKAFKSLCARNGGDWELHLVGGVDDSHESADIIERLKRAAGDMPVILHINADRSELMSLYRASKIYWHAAGFEVDDRREPDRVEHFGMAVAEAMSYGCIPLAVNRGGLREIIEHGLNGFLWESLDDLVEMTSKLMAGGVAPITSARACERSLEFSRKKFRERILGVIPDTQELLEARAPFSIVRKT